MAPDTAAGRRRAGGLLWHSDFRLFWFGETTSKIGSQMTIVAMPLVAVVVLRSSTLVVGLLQACTWVPWLLIGLPAGAWVDRLLKRRVMLWCDAVSFALFISVPVAAWTGLLTEAQLVLVALLTGTASVFFSAAYVPYVRSLVPSADRLEANAKLQGSASAAQIAGPGLGGLIAQALGAVYSLLGDALTFAVSAWCLLRIRTAEILPQPRADDGESLRASIAVGVRFIVHDPYLRVMTLYAGLGNFGEAIMQAVLVVFLVRTVGVHPGTAGSLIACMSLGGVVGAVLASRISRSLGTARGMLACEVLASPFILLIPCTTRGVGLLFFVFGGIVYLGGIIAANIMIATFAQAYVPPSLMARNAATINLVVYGSQPLGAVAGAFIGQDYGPRAALWVAAIITTLSVGILFVGPVKNNRDLPAEQANMP